jgi:hypothetical protein
MLCTLPSSHLILLVYKFGLVFPRQDAQRSFPDTFPALQAT